MHDSPPIHHAMLRSVATVKPGMKIQAADGKPLKISSLAQKAHINGSGQVSTRVYIGWDRGVVSVHGANHSLRVEY